MTQPTWIIEVYADDGAVAWSGRYPVWAGDTHYSAMQRIARVCDPIRTGSRGAIVRHCAIGLSANDMVSCEDVFSGEAMARAAGSTVPMGVAA